MSQSLPGAHMTPNRGRRCNPLAGRTLVGVNYNVSTECNTSRPNGVLEDDLELFTIVIPPTKHRHSPDHTLSSFVIEDEEGSSPQPTNSSQFFASSTTSPTNPTTSVLTSSTSPSKSAAPSSVASLTLTSSLLDVTSSFNPTSSVLSTSISSAVARPPKQDDPGNPPSPSRDPSPPESKPGTGNSPPDNLPPSNASPSNASSSNAPPPSSTTPSSTSPNNPPPAPKPTDRNTPQDNSSQIQKSTDNNTKAPKASTPEPRVEATPTSVETSSGESRQSSSNGLPNTPVPLVSPPPSSNVNSPTSQTAEPATSDQGTPKISGPINNPGAKPSNPGVVVPAIPIPTTLETTANNLLPTTEKEAENTPATSASPIAISTEPFTGNLPDTTSIGRPRGGKGPVDAGVSPASGSHGKTQMSTGAIVGISVGSVAFIALIALSIWLCRRRSKKQRVESMLNPPLSRSNTGPKIREMATLGATKSCLFQWLPGNGKDLTGGNNPVSLKVATATPNMSERTAMPGLLGGDATSNHPRTQPGYNGHFRGEYSINGANWPELGVNQGQIDPLNPFSDRHAVELSGQPLSFPPAALFFDMPGEYRTRPMPSNGPAKSRQSRGRSLSVSARASQYPAVQPLESRPHSVHRESVQSIDSFTTRRNKFRSDPFDLEEIESRLLSGPSQVPEMPRRTATSSKYSSRADSTSSSRYTSGISVSDWSLFHASRTTGPSAPAPANKLVSWDNLSSVHGFRPGDRSRPSKDKQESAVMFGQAL